MKYIELYDHSSGESELVGKVEFKDGKIDIQLPPGLKNILNDGLMFKNKLVYPADGETFLDAIVQECNRGFVKTSTIKEIK